MRTSIALQSRSCPRRHRSVSLPVPSTVTTSGGSTAIVTLGERYSVNDALATLDGRIQRMQQPRRLDTFGWPGSILVRLNA